VSLTNLTIYTNTADYDGTGTGHGGGISVGSGTVTLQDTLISGNADKSGSNSKPDCSGTLTSNGYNLLGNMTGCTMTPTTGDQVGVDPKLGPLADNGGPSLPYAPAACGVADSAAIDAANPSMPGSGGNACAATDQRWAVRPVDGDGNSSTLCDIGAYEAGAITTGRAW
jgi:hypothetical protein